MILLADTVRLIAGMEPDKQIVMARGESEAIIRHYYDDKDLIDEYLTIINGYENDRQHELRRNHALPNSHLVDTLLKPLDTVFSAKGGSVNFGVNESYQQDFFEKLLDVKDGMSLKQYISSIWRERFVVDPNGILFCDSKDGKAYLTYKSIFSIRNYKTSGYSLEWICFEHHKETDKGKYYWVVDDANFYEVYISDKTNKITQIIQNPFGIVPGVVNSPIYNTRTQRRDSIISKQVGILNSYLTKNSVKEIHQFLHLYPVFWQFQTICPKCNGRKTIDGEVCSTCNGSGFLGKKDVSDVIAIKLPEPDEPTISPPPAGYVQPDIATMEAQRIELDWLFDKLHFSIWGATTEKAANETATGRFIDVQPVVNKCTFISDIAESVHTKIMNLFGRFYYSETYKPGVVLYGKRFMIETPDQIWTKYITAKEKKAPVSTLNLLLDQYYMTEFANDEKMYSYYYRLMEVEPFVHSTIDDVMTLPIPDQEKAEKIYFESWTETKQVNDVILSTTEKLKSELTIFANEKLKAWQKN